MTMQPLDLLQPIKREPYSFEEGRTASKRGIFSDGTLASTVVRDKDGTALNASDITWEWANGRSKTTLVMHHQAADIMLQPETFSLRVYKPDPDNGWLEIELQEYPVRLFYDPNLGFGAHPQLQDPTGRAAINVDKSRIHWHIGNTGAMRGTCYIYLMPQDVTADFDPEQYFVLRERTD